MGKRKLLHAVEMFALGMLFVRIQKGYPAVLAVSLLCFLWMVTQNRKHMLSKIAIMIGCFCFGMLHMYVCVQNRPQLDQMWDKRAKVCGSIFKKEIKNDQVIYYLSEVTVSTDTEKVICRSAILYPSSDTYPIGTKIYAKGTISAFEQARNQGNYDEHSYFLAQNIDFKVMDSEIIKVQLPKTRWNIRQLLYDERQRITEFQRKHLPYEEGDVLAALTLGEKGSLDKEVKELYQMAGLSHVLAISGLHISIIGMGLYQLLRKRRGIVASALLAGVFVVLYAIMSGQSVSVFRSSGMFVVFLLARIMGEGYDSLTAMGIIGFVTLFFNPEILLSVSFVYSYAAVAVVVSFAIPMTAKYTYDCREKKRRIQEGGGKVKTYVALKEKVIQQFVFAFFIQLGVLPLSAHYFYEVPSYVVILNVILLPLLPVLLVLGLSGGILLIPFFLFPCHLILYGYEWLSDISIHLPYSRIVTGQMSIMRIILYYLILYLGKHMILAGHNNLEKNRYLVEKWNLPGNKKFSWSGHLQKIKYGIWMFGLMAIIFIPQRHAFEIHVLDVGQGDGIYVTEEHRINIMIDGGSTSVKEVGKYRILPFLKARGVRSIDYWFITHGDLDHVSGLMEAMNENYPIKQIVLSKYVVETENILTIKNMAHKKQIPIRYMDVGDRLVVHNLSLTCIYPDAAFATEDPNAASLILLLKYHDFTGIFAGDTDAQQEKILAGKLSALNIDFYKAAHHGANGSNSEEILSCYNPKIVAISCGKDNCYGHPGAEAMARMWQCARKIYFTMDEGEVTIYADGSGEQFLDKDKKTIDNK